MSVTFGDWNKLYAALDKLKNVEKETIVCNLEEDTKCPKCGSTKISLYDRVIGYLTKIKNWSQGRQIEQKTRVYSK